MGIMKLMADCPIHVEKCGLMVSVGELGNFQKSLNVCFMDGSKSSENRYLVHTVLQPQHHLA